MSDAPERIWCRRDWQGKWHEGDWTDIEPGGAEYSEYLRADIAAAREAELRAEVERLTEANREAAMKSLADLGQAQEALDRAIAADAEAARLRGLLDEAREVTMCAASSLAAAISLLERGGKAAKKAAPSDTMFDVMLNDYRTSLEKARAALAKIGGQHE